MADRTPDTGTPLWVKVFGIIVIVVVLLFVIGLVTKGPHRPGLHASSGAGLYGLTQPEVGRG